MQVIDSNTVSNRLSTTIAIVLPSLAGGGAERVMLDLAYEFQKSGVRAVFVVCVNDGEFTQEAKSSFEVISLNIGRLRNTLLPLASALRHLKPDGLLVGMWPLTSIAILAAKLSRSRCRVVVSDHNILSIQYRDWGRRHRLALRSSIRLTYPLAHACVGVSQGVVSDLISLGNLNSKRVHVIHNPIRPPGLLDKESLDGLDLGWNSSHGKRILAVGSLKPVKNFALLIDAFRILSQTVNAQLTILGEGQLRSALESQIVESGPTDRVSLPGFHTDPTAYYQSADLFVLSSDNEGFGNVIVEALACGTPVVATDCPAGPREILKDGQYGVLVPPRDAQALAEAMKKSLESPHDRLTLQQRASDFSPQIAAQRYLELLIGDPFRESQSAE